ncbi:response regulator transcription factor [Helcococcus ovis]|uniref:response regulator transcription factor n=2 Tax=Helcococcus ovis TaxID=72026 RepID=UPI00106F7684|nr:response regulator transcription factor [Helcococcus ovis]TFF65931.1 response regulator transcription factor [Helcococcus ovis]WNZ01777.1 response regulator transcription factor [Helcococcus ovis]
MTKIILIDDDKLICDSLKIILESKGYEVSGIAYNGVDGFNLFEKTHPDIILMDIRMKEQNGIETSEKILEKYPDAKILLLTTFKDEEYITRAISNGVKGYILKDNFSSLLSSIETVLSGNIVFDSEVVQNISIHKKSNITIKNINQKEMEIIKLVAEGLNNKEIAEKLFLSQGTVRNYLSTILDKLNLRDRTQLAIYYLNNK